MKIMAGIRKSINAQCSAVKWRGNETLVSIDEHEVKSPSRVIDIADSIVNLASMFEGVTIEGIMKDNCMVYDNQTLKNLALDALVKITVTPEGLALP